MNIRPLTLKDIDSAAAIENACFPDPWTRRMLEDSIAADCAVCYGAEEDGVLAGALYAMDVSGDISIDNIAVLPEFRRRGIASALLDRLCVYMRDTGGSFITLEVRSLNTGAIALYGKFGFKRVGLRKGYYKDPPDDAVIMTKYNENTIDRVVM